MIHPLPEFPPLFPSGRWWRTFLTYLLKGETEVEAIRGANRASGLKSREWMRFMIADREGNCEMLSFPVTGGASALKNGNPAGWLLPENAPFAAVKLDKTLATLSGSLPFYRLLDHRLSLTSLLSRVDDGRVESLNRMAFEETKKILYAEDIINYVKSEGSSPAETRRLVEEKTTEFTTCYAEETSILNLIYRKGPEAILGLIPSF